jgi:hypothetical protein
VGTFNLAGFGDKGANVGAFYLESNAVLIY